MVSKGGQTKLPENLFGALTEVKEFIKYVKATSTEFNNEFTPAYFFSHNDLGSVFFDVEDAARYRMCIRKIIDSKYINDQISQKTIETAVQRAILSSLDANDKYPEIGFEKRLEDALITLKNEITKKSVQYKIFYPVNGMAQDGLPFKFGKVTFSLFDGDLAKEVYEIPIKQPILEEEKQKRVELIKEMISSELIGKTVGVLLENAVDPDAAQSLALKRLRITVDILNFYSDLIPYSSGYFYLPGDIDSRLICVPIIYGPDTCPGFSINNHIVGPLGPISFSNLMSVDEKNRLGITRVNQFLQEENKNDLEEGILASLQWAGRASVESRKEEAFLLYAIALESLIMIDNDHDELTYRLSTRIAHLIGKNCDSRKRIVNEVKALYNTRSKIVHSGKYQVTDADLAYIRLVTKNCILRIIIEPPFNSMKTINELVGWFNEQILN